MSLEEKIMKSISVIAKIYTGRTVSTADDINAIYDSGKYPDFNADVDYIITGER